MANVRIPQLTLAVGISGAEEIELAVPTGDVVTPYVSRRTTTQAVANLAAGIRLSVPVTVTGDFTVGPTDELIIVNHAGTTTATLPAAADYPGRTITIKTIQAQTVVSASSNVAPLTSASLGTAILAATAGKWATLHSDGSAWAIMQGN